MLEEESLDFAKVFKMSQATEFTAKTMQRVIHQCNISSAQGLPGPVLAQITAK